MNADLPPPLTDAEILVLRRVAADMIPASAQCDVPAADDDAIFGDLLRTAAPAANQVRAALARLNGLAGGAYASLGADERSLAAEQFREDSPALALLLATLVSRCYYRDDRVMRSLGMEVRPPFPKGFHVEPGDWSLLDPVRSRPKIYRDAP